MADHDRSESDQASHRISKSWRPRARKEKGWFHVTRVGQTVKAAGQVGGVVAVAANRHHVLAMTPAEERRERGYLFCASDAHCICVSGAEVPMRIAFACQLRESKITVAAHGSLDDSTYIAMAPLIICDMSNYILPHY